MSVVPSGPARRLSGDQGSALVEAGLLSPVFLFLLLAIIEYGFYFGSYLAVGRAAADAARTASVMGNAPDADYEIVQSIRTSLAALPVTDVKKIIVFNANARGPRSTADVEGAACSPMTDAPVATLNSGCNGYTGVSSFLEPKVRFGCAAPNTLSQGFCPTSRKVAFAAPGGPPDYVGIYIRYEHGFITGLFGDSQTIQETVITRVEPTEVS